MSHEASHTVWRWLLLEHPCIPICCLKVLAGLVQSGPLELVWAGADVKTGGLCSRELSRLRAGSREESRRRLNVEGLVTGFSCKSKMPFCA